ncbi:cytochrome P450 [Actinomycetospora endophytica]|uniref:Cytochrome P450 n=1 Tax=Actinomycetospora endophytica TaxID=2291215 RepID=A0ABS8PBX0_9PSEU|nr:cytochrome P450 [Actinomycetospora endophytica]MCD2194921.1 cytochrome P450 [Actinomycetospora endophytica]
MTDLDTALPQLPFATPDPLGLAPELASLREHAPITRVRTRTGDEAWLVTSYEQVRALLADPRLGRSHPEPEKAARLHDGMLLGGPSGDPEHEQEFHQRMRRLLAPAFSARRMRALDDHVRELVAGLIDDLLAREQPADVHDALSVPLPTLVICELLGVPYADRDRFRGWSEQAGSFDGESSRAGITALGTYVYGLLAEKREHPGEDVLSDLVAAQREDPALSDMMVTGIATALLFAGHETTVNRIDAGVLRLFPHEGPAHSVPDDDVAGFVEELLRMPVPGGGRGGGLIRYANTEVAVGDVVVAPGDAVVLSIGAANQDPSVFDAPGTLDETRAPNPHLGFGHGAHHCVGASLARVELRAVFAALTERVPNLRVAVPLDELRLRPDSLTGGITELPVTW